MRTNIVLDKALVDQAFRFTDCKTKRELIQLALQEFVANHSRKDVRELIGTVKLRADYNHKALRKES